MQKFFNREQFAQLVGSIAGSAGMQEGHRAKPLVREWSSREL